MAGSDEVIHNLQAYFNRTVAALEALGYHYAAKMEAEAKNPPYPLRPLRRGEKGPGGERGTWVPSGKGPYKWRDQTSHARQGLFGTLIKRDSTLLVRVGHSMGYGHYLELANQGRYAVLEPTVKRNAPDFFRDAERVING